MGTDHHGARVVDVLARGLAPIGQAHHITAQANEPPVEHLLGANRVLAQVVTALGTQQHLGRRWKMASVAHVSAQVGGAA